VAPAREGYYPHGPAQVVEIAPISYGSGRHVLDIRRGALREVGRLSGFITSASGPRFVPIPERRLAIINQAHVSAAHPTPGGPMRRLSISPTRRSPSLEPSRLRRQVGRFCERGGRAGLHNQHHDNGLPHLFHLTISLHRALQRRPPLTASIPDVREI
jgi:hypothetical protein